MMDNQAMFILDFHCSEREAFFHGFAKGLAAPVMLYHADPAPEIPRVEPVYGVTSPVYEVLASDWRMIGGDLFNVIAQHDGTQGAI